MDTIKTGLDNVKGVQINTEIENTYEQGHSGHSIFIDKLIINNIIKKTKEVEYIEVSNTHIKETIGQFTVSSVSKPTEICDPRFHSQSFRDAVRIVLEYFGYEQPTFKDFREVELKFSTVDGRPRIDWIEFSKRISHPRFIASCFVLDRQKNHCSRIGVTLFGDTKGEALKTLSPCYEFKRWFE